MLSIFSLALALLSDCKCLFSSSVDLSPGTMIELCDVIESTCAVVIALRQQTVVVPRISDQECLDPLDPLLRQQVCAPRLG